MAYDFDKIAHAYDRLNRIMTLGIDRLWRRRAVRLVVDGARGAANGKSSAPRVLDVACGTGDVVAELLKNRCLVTGIDLSEEMLAVARHKCSTLPAADLAPASPVFQIANAEQLPFPDGAFDAVTCAFGVRNFVHLEQGLAEMLRVLKPDGRMVILEMATPDSPLVKPLYNLYTRHIIPWLGSRLAGNREAYTYLPASIARFPKGEVFLNIVRSLGADASQRKFTFGVCRMYVITKRPLR